MNDYRAWIFHVNRLDLLANAVASASVLKENLTIIDNSPDGGEEIGNRFHPNLLVFRPCVPLSCSQSFNFIMRETLRAGTNICIWMHSDAEASDDSCCALLDLARQYNQEQRRWGFIFTNYDALCAINADMLADVGLWDTNLFQYCTDNDYHRRARSAGYECINTEIPVMHIGSQTLKSDSERQFMNSFTFPLALSYYALKWGGNPGHESYALPFNRLV